MGSSPHCTCTTFRANAPKPPARGHYALFDALSHPGVVAPPEDELAVETIHTLVIDTHARSLTMTDGCRAPRDADLGARVWYL